MFTGIISETGKVLSAARRGGVMRLAVSCSDIRQGLKKGDSVAVNGVCLTVVENDADVLFEVVGNTLDKTGLKRLKKGDAVNLEGAMRMGEKVSGHMVSGHIDGERMVKRNAPSPKGRIMDVQALRGDERYLVPKGSVAVDGVSLTVGEVQKGFFRVFIIPLTQSETTLKLKKCGDYVNVEFDMVAKYSAKDRSSDISEDMLREKGFI